MPHLSRELTQAIGGQRLNSLPQLALGENGRSELTAFAGLADTFQSAHYAAESSHVAAVMLFTTASSRLPNRLCRALTGVGRDMPVGETRMPITRSADVLCRRTRYRRVCRRTRYRRLCC